MALPQVSDVTAAARPLLTDTFASGAGETYTDDVLLPFVQRAYRYAARYLRAKQVSILRYQSSPIKLAVGKTAFTRSPGTAPNFPTDMVRPIMLRERPSGGGQKYKNMKISDNFLPDQDAGKELALFDWRNDTLEFIGATVDVDIQMQYEADLPELTDVDDTILIPDSVDALAGLVAAFAAESRDEQTNSTRLQTNAERDLDLIAAAELLVRRAKGAQFGGN